MLAEVTPLASEGLADWIESLPSHHRSPHRTAWRCYVAWRASLGEDVPDLVPPEPLTPVPPEVTDAIADMLAVSHLRPRSLAALTRGARVASEAKERAFPGRVFFTAPEGVSADFALLPREALDVIAAWGWQDDAPASAPVVPRAPGDMVPMAPTTMQRLLRERRRAG
jgi:hypothetical protein